MLLYKMYNPFSEPLRVEERMNTVELQQVKFATGCIIMPSKDCIAIKTSLAAYSGRLTKDWMSNCNMFSLWCSACGIQDQVVISYWVEVNAASSCKHRDRRFLIRLHTPGNCLCQSEGLLYVPQSKSLLLKFKVLACLMA